MRGIAPSDAELAGSRQNAGAGFGEALGMSFAGVFGLLLGLSLVKFGNPVVIKEYVTPPHDTFEWLLSSWPAEIGYWLVAGLAVLGVLVARRKPGVPLGILVLPAAWLVWEIVSGTQSVDKHLSHETLIHFLCCVACFYLGLFSLSGVRRLWPFWLGLMTGYALVLLVGFDQHFGGLEQTRKYFYLYIYPTLTQPPPEDFIKRMSVNRIFSTLFYANTLAGVILILLPIGLALISSIRQRLTPGARGLLLALFGAASLACLYWSGSKGGWLLMLLIGMVAILFRPLPRKVKLAVIGSALVFGLAGFFIKYAGFFQKGAPSAVARFDYWRGGLHAAKERPVLGSGPGTFGIEYRKFSPDAKEKPMVAHNDYLQQASDSGVPGFLLYTGFVVGCIGVALKRWKRGRDGLELAVWLGLLGWALQSTVEFGLYIPAIAWPAFTLMGWISGRGAIRSTEAAGVDTVGKSV